MNAHAYAPTYTQTQLTFAAERKARLARFQQAGNARPEKTALVTYRETKPFVPEVIERKQMSELERMFWHSMMRNDGRSERVWRWASKAYQSHDISRRPTVRNILLVVSRESGVPVDYLLSGRRADHIVVPRQVAMYLAREITTLSFPEISRRLGKKDHTTAIHGCRKISALVHAGDPQICGLVIACTAELRARGYQIPEGC